MYEDGTSASAPDDTSVNPPTSTPPFVDHGADFVRHLRDYTYECFFPLTSAFIEKPKPETWCTWARKKFNISSESPAEYDVEAAPLLNDEKGAGSLVAQHNYYGKPPTSRLGVGLRFMYSTGSLIIGGSSSTVYINSSAKAGEWIGGQAYLAWARYDGFGVRDLIHWMGPVANGLLNSELLYRITSVLGQTHSPARKALTNRSNGWVVAGRTVCSLAMAIGGIFPLIMLDKKDHQSDIEEFEMWAGGLSNIPSAAYGAYRAIMFIMQHKQQSQCCKKISAFDYGRNILVAHLRAELSALQTNRGKTCLQLGAMTPIASNNVDSFRDELWENISKPIELEAILPLLFNISNVRGLKSDTYKRHDFSNNYLQIATVVIVVAIRIMSLIGFTMESWNGGKHLVEKEKEIYQYLLGGMFAFLNVTGQAGISIPTIDTLRRSVRDILDPSKALTAEQFKNPKAIILAMFSACIIGLFSGGTSGLAAEKNLKFMPKTCKDVFVVVSYFTSGLLINGFFCYQLLKRIITAYQAYFATQETKDFGYFINGMQNVINIIEQMDNEVYGQMINNEKIKPVIEKLYKTYEKSEVWNIEQAFDYPRKPFDL